MFRPGIFPCGGVSGVICVLLAHRLFLPSHASGAPTIVRMTEETIVKDVVPFGINVSAHETYGANAILNNIIPNPGFESGIYSIVIHADAGATGNRVPQAFWDPAWNNDDLGIGHPTGFWDGADYEVVYGRAKGRKGKVERFAIEDGHSVFHLDTVGPAPEKWDVVFVRRDAPGLNTAFAGDASTTRPGSPGRQSVRLRNPGEWKPAFAHYADSLWRDGDPSAGKLFLVRGEWRLEFWAKSGSPGQQLLAVFKREEEADFLNTTFDLTPEWTKYEVQFNVPESADTRRDYPAGAHRPILIFAFYLPQPDAEVWVDDVALYRPATNPTAFTDALVDRLKELRPGVLRFWAEQLGDSLDNQLAEPFARRPFGYKPDTRAPWMYSYGLHDFLLLCREIGGEPWYVIPPTFSPDELGNLVAYLAAPKGEHPYGDRRSELGQEEPWTSVFKSIHLEYGNEMWGSASGGDPFMGASALGGERLGTIAHERLGLLRKAAFFDPARFDLILGGQTFVPATQQTILARCQAADGLAFGPYFGKLDVYDTPEDIYGCLFASPFFETASGSMRRNAAILREAAHSPRMSIYEINFHTTHGDASEEVRNQFVAGAGGAIALPLSMLVYQRDLGITRQCAFTTAQYSFRGEHDQRVRLWGLLRDLEATGRKRPTWLGLELVNEVIRGNAVKTTIAGDNPVWRPRPVNGIDEEMDIACIQSFAFRDGPHNAIVLFNLSLTDSLAVEIQPSRTPARHAIHTWISPAKLDDTNEENEEMKIERAEIGDFAPGYRFDLPRHSVHAIIWQDAAN